MEDTKEAVVLRLAQSHYAIERGIVKIIRLLSDPLKEADPREPVKLLEINENTTADGIHPVFFGAHSESGIFFPSVIIEVTPNEFDGILQKPSLLPNGWRLGDELPRSIEPVAVR